MFCELWRLKSPVSDPAEPLWLSGRSRRKHSVLCAWLLEADGAVGQGTLQQSSSQTDPTDNFRNDGCQNSSEISRHLSGWACSQNLKQRGYDLWELWVWRSISSFACASGRVRAAQPSLAQPCTESLLEQSLPSCWSGNCRFPEVPGRYRSRKLFQDCCFSGAEWLSAGL